MGGTVVNIVTPEDMAVQDLNLLHPKVGYPKYLKSSHRHCAMGGPC